MKLYLKLSLACLSMGVVAGCQTISRTGATRSDCRSPALSLCQTKEPVAESIRVRTGGLLSTTSEIQRSVEDNLTLRQLLLEVGGIKKSEQTFVRREILPSQTRVGSMPQASAETRLAPTQSDRQRFEIVDSIFAESETERLKSLFVDPGSTKWETWNSLNADRVLDPAEYLHLALDQINRTAQNEPEGDWFNGETRDLDELVAMAIRVFSFNRDRNPAYVDEIVGKLRTLSSNTPAASSARATNVMISIPDRAPLTQVATPIATTQTSIVEGVAARELVLVGLLRNGRTNYFHLFLIDHTALGEILLQDKDFVFAIEANRTSLRSHVVDSPDFYVPVGGVGSGFNSVLASTHPTFRDILGLVDVDQFTDDSVLIVERASLQKNTMDSFHLPLAFLGENVDSAKQILGESRVQPGDSVAFTTALHTPIVQTEFLTQMQRITQQMRQGNGRLKAVQDANQSRIVRTASNISDSVRYVTRRFTSQIGN